VPIETTISRLLIGFEGCLFHHPITRFLPFPFVNKLSNLCHFLSGSASLS
jgi:hypothetical protein